MVTLVGISGDKAVLTIGGGAPKVLRVGEVHQSIRLIAVEGNQVVVEEDGQRRTLSMGFASSGSASANSARQVVLNADGRGHFIASGQVNQADVRFVVDTGASLVTLPKSLALRAGVALDNARRASVTTAGGVVPAWRVTLNRVRLDGITLHMVEAVVLEDVSLPMALLGMSFLNRTNMNREGDRLTLTQRY